MGTVLKSQGSKGCFTEPRCQRIEGRRRENTYLGNIGRLLWSKSRVNKLVKNLLTYIKSIRRTIGFGKR